MYPSSHTVPLKIWFQVVARDFRRSLGDPTDRWRKVFVERPQNRWGQKVGHWKRQGHHCLGVWRQQNLHISGLLLKLVHVNWRYITETLTFASTGFRTSGGCFLREYASSHAPRHFQSGQGNLRLQWFNQHWENYVSRCPGSAQFQL